ncbi:type 2 lanthipeptide synthetase LanM family protein [Actinomadura sp. DC4]|uniref:type 2 lanthipeptide synthetase LanM family protein n=1 Tax=Actinomadura sp. DC4 TaxID=3055069 RepID=UPI0025B02DBA|nr:type 2 lanthipeptide synthetase LanM family protein [Actinomadura sp. DC4]MDN3356445.1 type 2 lanthipeptide synthetase LanM family protein [Actinomadura sp. DC4]
MTQPARQGERTAARLPGPDWWVRALARHERPDTAAPDAGLARPAWCDFAEQAVAAALPPEKLPDTDAWDEAFAVPFRPFLALVRDRLTTAAGPLTPDAVDVPAMTQAFTDILGRDLAGIALRTLMAELSAARADGRLSGADDRERFADFLRGRCTSAGLAALFAEYPVLARMLATAAMSAAEAGAELLARLTADRAALVETLLEGVDPGPVTAIEPGLGDTHQQGRSVGLVRFADGRTVVYKPRSLAAHERFGAIVGWFNQRLFDCELRTARTLARPGYGWVEFVEALPLRSPEDARRFYRRAGALLAVLHVLHATDMHCENLIASGDQPVLIDVETVLHPDLPRPDTVTIADPAAHALAVSVQRTALLPYVTVGENGLLDQSGMGGDPGTTCPESALDWEPPASAASRLVRRPVPYVGARNRPGLDGRLLEPADYQFEVLEGFRRGYDAAVRNRAELVRFLEALSEVQTRVVVRPSRGYEHLMDESTAPGLLRDALDRDEALDLLDDASRRHHLWQRLAPHERTALWAGDIPLISGRPATRDLWTCTGAHLPGLLERSGLECALEKLAAMGEIDRGEQEWLIRASLAARRPVEGHRSTRPGTGRSRANADPGRLLATAAGLADEIVARSETLREEDDGDRINWLGLQLVDEERWMVLPMGASLGDGYLGVALFLAQLTQLTGISRYGEAARRALGPVPELLETLAGRPDLLGAIGCGSGAGLGGMSYALARLATLLGDRELRDWAETSVGLTARAVEVNGPAGPHGWMYGTAGCLAAMTAVHREIGSRAAGSLAVVCADLLADLIERAERRGEPVEDLPGFAAGAAGMGWALHRFAADAPESRHFEAAGRALRRAAGETDFGDGWCCGTAGRLIARACLTGEGEAAETETEIALRALAERPVLGDLSLCHGELGIADAALVLTAIDPGRAWRRRAELILDAVQRHGPTCATPGGIVTPGLLHGLAGIGYGLLRIGFAPTIPSLLLLEPTPPTSTPISGRRPAAPGRRESTTFTTAG